MKVAFGAYNPLCILELVESGLDLFDSTLPVFNADDGIALILPFIKNDQFR